MSGSKLTKWVQALHQNSSYNKVKKKLKCVGYIDFHSKILWYQTKPSYSSTFFQNWWRYFENKEAMLETVRHSKLPLLSYKIPLLTHLHSGSRFTNTHTRTQRPTHFSNRLLANSTLQCRLFNSQAWVTIWSQRLYLSMINNLMHSNAWKTNFFHSKN